MIPGTNPRDFVFLGRLEGCEEQCRHRDAKHGAFFIYALTDNYTVRVWDGTHLPENDVLQRMDDMIDDKAPDVETTEGRLITLKKGEMLIVHARVVHAGGPASTGQEPANDRFQDLAIHGFLDEDAAPPHEKNATYPVFSGCPVQETADQPMEVDADANSSPEDVTVKGHMAAIHATIMEAYSKPEHKDYGEFRDSAYLLMLHGVGVGRLNVENHLKQKWRDLELAWSNRGTDIYGKTMATRLHDYTGTAEHTLESFSKYLAMAVHRTAPAFAWPGRRHQSHV